MSLAVGSRCLHFGQTAVSTRVFAAAMMVSLDECPSAVGSPSSHRLHTRRRRWTTTTRHIGQRIVTEKTLEKHEELLSLLQLYAILWREQLKRHDGPP